MTATQTSGAWQHGLRDDSLRRDGDLLLSGQAEFLDDLNPAGLHHMAILRSPHAHARIKGIDVSRASRSRGVRAVLTGLDAQKLTTPLPHFFDPAIIGSNSAEFWCLAVGRVRWQGEPVVAIAADSLANAEGALELVEVEYEPLPAVLTIEEALEDEAPRVFEDWSDNVLGRYVFSDGNAQAKLLSAPHVLTEELAVGRHQSTPMETRGYLAAWGPGNSLKFWGSTQNPHPVRSNLALALGVPEQRIQVVATRLGGGFGHKFNGFAEEYLVCLMSRMVGAPVKWIETRKESLLVGARDFLHRLEVGFDSDGRLLAIRAKILGNIGGLGTWGGWAMVYPAGMTFPGPYALKDYEVESVGVVTNKAPWSGYRGYGKEQTAIALERLMDVIARHLAIDPAEVRRTNFIPPEAFPYWTIAMHLDSGEYAATLDRVLALADYDTLREQQATARDTNRHYGIGIAFELTPESGDFANSFVRGFDSSTVRVAPTGGVTVLTGVTTPGTGNDTSIAYLVARELGIAATAVDVVQGDTGSCPYGFGSFSSRSLSTGGAAAVLAARDLREQMAEAAAVLLECDSEDLEFASGLVRVQSRTEKAIAFAELAGTIVRQGLATPGLTRPLLEATRVARPHNFQHFPDESGRTSAYPSFPYSAHVALVELDPETGIIVVEKYFAVGDCGVIISEKFVTGQLHGAIAQGIGGALWEEQPYDRDGTCRSTTLKHYLVPRASDLPRFCVDHRETPSPFTLLGTKGAGESGVGGAMAAITNAVNDALAPLGVQARRLPLNPPAVLDAISGRRGS